MTGLFIFKMQWFVVLIFLLLRITLVFIIIDIFTKWPHYDVTVLFSFFRWFALFAFCVPFLIVFFCSARAFSELCLMFAKIREFVWNKNNFSFHGCAHFVSMQTIKEPRECANENRFSFLYMIISSGYSYQSLSLSLI